MLFPASRMMPPGEATDKKEVKRQDDPSPERNACFGKSAHAEVRERKREQILPTKPLFFSHGQNVLTQLDGIGRMIKDHQIIGAW